jgi:hypothetical protein
MRSLRADAISASTVSLPTCRQGGRSPHWRSRQTCLLMIHSQPQHRQLTLHLCCTVFCCTVQ